MAGAEKKGFGEEAQRGFAAGQSLDDYGGLYRLVLTSYSYRCALTGAQFAPAGSLLHPDLDVVAIQPREQGGALSIANFLPMLHSLVSPFRQGLIVVEDDFRILVPQPHLLGQDMLAGLRVRLAVPQEVIFQPGASFLAHHRRFALGR